MPPRVGREGTRPKQAIDADPQARFDDGLPHVARVSDRPANQSKSNKPARFPAALVETGEGNEATQRRH